MPIQRLRRRLSQNLSLSKISKNISNKVSGRNSAQLELPIHREIEADRNADKGGRSFYFFDFDDNIAFLATPSFIFHKSTGRELVLTSGEFAQNHRDIGFRGQFADFEVRLDSQTGTFRYFRDQDINLLEKVLGKKQAFVQDLGAALGLPDFRWKGPSWDCFYHAVFNQRPLSLITARGHSQETIRAGIRLLVARDFIPHEPNYLSVYPVSNPEVKKSLGIFDESTSVANLKKAAIRASVEAAILKYGYSPHHRFGMSDDDPHNIALIVEEMTSLKSLYPEMSFFVIETKNSKSQRGHSLCSE
jgi:hypothetical protein